MTTRIQQNLKQRRPQLSLPIPLQPLPQFIPLLIPNRHSPLPIPRISRRSINSSDILDIFPKQQAMNDASNTIVIDLKRPRSQLAHLDTILLSRFPIRYELHIGPERACRYPGRNR